MGGVEMSDIRGRFTSTGTILVLFILLVIVSCSCFFN
ncbi:YjcZ family sporulation protein [Paenibacillus sp. GCM10027629]